MRIGPFLASLLLLFTAGHLRSQTAEEQIRELLRTQEVAWNAGDIDAFMEGYAKGEDLHFLGAAGLTSGWQGTIASYKKRYPDRESMGKLGFELHEITERTEDIYTVIGQYNLERPQLGNLTGYFLLVLQKLDGRWKIVADSTH